MVPYHRLPELHEAVKTDLPKPYDSTIAAYREIIPTLIRQMRNPEYYVRRQLPNRSNVPALSCDQFAVRVK
jgi:fatty acid desaturase